MSKPERQQSVLELLKNLRGLEPLKKLFWSELSYQRVNKSLSRRGWSDAATQALAEDPVLFAGGGEDESFHVIYARLASEHLRLGDERPVVSRLLKDHPYALFAFSNSSQDRWHFLNVKYDEKAEKRRLFRRITVGAGERLRTASERLAMLDLEAVSQDLYGISPLAIQQRHDQAFDVEAVTKKFFEQYAQVFARVEGLIQGLKDSERKRLFTQRLFNRLMFIAFIQKKGWLKFNSDTDYLPALWKAYQRDNSSEKNFYNQRLKILFFLGLNTPNEVDLVGINRGGFLKDLIGEVPYLNGGLFEEDDDDKNSAVVIPDECIAAILDDLFDRFNFTVTESTPLDVEVAVDPEMLGKVFEELVTGRHETGSYYTPKPVVSFMGREALKGYLTSKLPDELPAAIEKFVDQHDPAGLRNAEAVLDTLRRVKACDPACGSGAYLLGMLHELMDLRQCLFVTKKLDPLSAYDRKLEIIQNSVYGVDLDPFAVNIARLRLWLSLAVDFEGDHPPPLPNLDFKIEAGDSLTAPDPSGGETPDMYRHTQIENYYSLKAKYLMAHGSEKLELRKQIETARKEIAEWAHEGHGIAGFDWSVEFAEVFEGGGFDIIVANPPYVRADAQFKHIEKERERQSVITKWKDYRAALLKSEIYQTIYEKWDLYLPFLERAYQLMCPGGQMVFIISDAYNAAKYAKKSHEFFLENSRIARIDFCSDIPLFEAGVSNTILHFAKAKPRATDAPIRVRRWGERPGDFEINTEPLDTTPQSKFGVALFKPDGSKEAHTAGKYVPLASICYISYGLAASSDEVKHKGEFVTADVLSDVRDKAHPKCYIEGKDIVRWYVKRERYLEWGTKRAPSKFRRPTFIELHEAKEKLIALVVASRGPPVIFDESQRFTTHTSCIFVPWHYLRSVRNQSIKKTAKYRDEVKSSQNRPAIYREELEKLSKQFTPKFLLAIMNSTFTRDWISKKRRSKIHVYPDDWKSFPIPPATTNEQAPIVSLVDKILALYAKHGHPLPPAVESRLTELEIEIDERVARLYGVEPGDRT